MRARAMNANVWLVRIAFEEAVGERATELMHRASKRLANRTPLEVAQQPGGASIVLAEINKIAMDSLREQ
jgi:hypothetical protein